MSEPITIEMPADDVARAESIMGKIRGWSGLVHYAFFTGMLDELFARDPAYVPSILVLGVYHGRDIAFLIDILRHKYPHRSARIVGVDRFTADPCADWAPANRIKTWEEEAHCPPPSFEEAVKNTRDPSVEIIRSDDFAFLDTTQAKFHAVYFDTAHDFNTLIRQLRQVRRVCHPGALLCGDDYSDQYTWGVISAVTAGFTEHKVFGGWIWSSDLQQLKTAL